MATPIPPQYEVDTVVLHSLTINYEPTWNGSSWVIDPAKIRVVGIGNLAKDGNPVLQSDYMTKASDMPVGAHTAMQQLLDYIEQQMATKYS